MPVWLIRLLRKIVVIHHFATDKAFQGQCSKHVETETESCDLHHEVALGGEIVQYVALGEIAKSKEACQCHDQTCNARHQRAVVCDSRKAVNRRSLERSVD